MAMILRNQNTRNEVQSKVAAELQARLDKQREIEHEAVDPAFLEKQHTTRVSGILIAFLMLLLLIAVIWAATKL